MTHTLALATHVFPSVTGQPDAVVHVPRGYDHQAPLAVIVYLHGWRNCARNVVRATDGACRRGGGERVAADLAGQLDRSGQNAILVVPQLGFDEQDSTAGRFAEPGHFKAFVGEVLEKLGDRRTLARVVVVSHSGGYRAAASIVSRGGVEVDEVVLLDSLYGETDAFQAWVRDGARRLVVIYTDGGGTAERARELPRGERIIVEKTARGHEELPRAYFGRLVAAPQG